MVTLNPKKAKKKGYDAEREIVHKLRDEGFQAIRIPVSAPSNEPLPDVFAVRGRLLLALEVKSMKKYAYYKKPQVEKLFDFLGMFTLYKGFVVLAAKFNRKGWLFKIVEKAEDYALKSGGEGLTFEELLKELK